MLTKYNRIYSEWAYYISQPCLLNPFVNAQANTSSMASFKPPCGQSLQ